MDKVWELAKKNRYRLFDIRKSGISALIKITSSCRSRCRYCLSWQTTQDILSSDLVVSALKDIRKFAAHQITLSGGEPTTHPDFSRIVEECAKAEIHVTVITDGQYSHESSWISAVDEFTFSIDTHSPDIYKLIRGIDGLSKALDNLSRAVKAGVTVSVNIVLSNQAIRGIENTVDLLVNKGVNRIHFLELETHLAVGDGLLPSNDDLSKFRGNILPALESKYSGIILAGKVLTLPENIRCNSNSIPCLIPWMHVTIRPNGNIYPCCRIGDDTPKGNNETFCLGNVKENSISDIWQSRNRKHVQTTIATSPPLPCRKCGIGPLFQNEEEVWNQIETIRM